MPPQVWVRSHINIQIFIIKNLMPCYWLKYVFISNWWGKKKEWEETDAGYDSQPDNCLSIDIIFCTCSNHSQNFYSIKSNQSKLNYVSSISKTRRSKFISLISKYLCVCLCDHLQRLLVNGIYHSTETRRLYTHKNFFRWLKLLDVLI